MFNLSRCITFSTITWSFFVICSAYRIDSIIQDGNLALYIEGNIDKYLFYYNLLLRLP